MNPAVAVGVLAGLMVGMGVAAALIEPKVVYRDRWQPHQDGPSIGFGERYWPNIESLAAEAAGAKWAKGEARRLQLLVDSIALSHREGVRVTGLAQALAGSGREPHRTIFEPQTGDYIILPPLQRSL